jgi:hypothetical protein
MSCSNDEFEQVTGVRLSANAWDRWSDDMDRRTEQLLALFVKAVKAEREACAKECDELAGILACHNDKDGSEICVSLRDTIRARGNT